jgi:hypothetical protein
MSFPKYLTYYKKQYVSPFLQATKALREIRGIALLYCLDLGTKRGEVTSRPGRFLPPGKTRYPLYRWPGGHQGRSGQVRKISPPPDSIAGLSSPQPVIMPIELPGSYKKIPIAIICPGHTCKLSVLQ